MTTEVLLKDLNGGEKLSNQSNMEPPMYMQRPSSARSQDVSHILTKTFRHLFTRDTIDINTVKNLDQSKGSTDEYHESYVAALNKAQEERNKALAETAMLERHIMQAQARAMSADERALSRLSGGSDRFPDLGLPPVRAHFRSCIDTALLRSHNLLTPEDFTADELPIVPPPKGPVIPEYARETRSSSVRRDLREAAGNISPWQPDEILDHPELSGNIEPEQDVEVMSFISEDEFQIQKVQKQNSDDSSSEPSNINLWRQQINPEQRESDRKDLANLQAKVDYLKNPRHAIPSALGDRNLLKPRKKISKQVGIKPSKESTGKKEPSVIFLPSPTSISFTEYDISKVYEMTLELKNVTSVLRPIRVIPPRTEYFSVSLGQFPGDEGLVAPGMSCHYTIRFAPDCLADFDDCIVVQTQSSSPLTIPLQGRRKRPLLTLPSQLSVGQCLVGGFKATQVLVKNEGGPGMFCMMAKHNWPTSNFKSVITPGGLSILPFQIRPSRFELGPQQSTIIDILFKPTEVKQYKQTISIVCDNCQVNHIDIVGEGETASVEIVSIEGGMSDVLAGEQTDLMTDCLMRFDTLNPYTYVQKTVIIKNKVNVDLPFDWKVSKPILKPPNNSKILIDGNLKKEENVTETKRDMEEDMNEKQLEDEKQETESNSEPKENTTEQTDDAKNTGDNINDKSNLVNTDNQKDDSDADPNVTEGLEDALMLCDSKDRIEDLQSAFSVTPKEAVLPAGGAIEFNVIFAPPQVAHYHSVLELVLQDIPIIPPEPPVIPVAVVAPSQRMKPPHSGTLGEGRNTVTLERNESRPGSVNIPPSGSPQGSRPPSTMSVAKSAGPDIQKLTTEQLALSIEAKGSCQAFSVQLQPYAIHLPGQQRVETAVRKQFRMINTSVSSILFKWEKVDADYILEVTPPLGELAAQSDWDLELTVSSSRPVIIDDTLICHVQHLDKPLMLHVYAEIKGPEVIIENPDMNLGLLQLGEIGKSLLTLRNTSQVTAQWSLKVMDSCKSFNSEEGPEEFTFLPASGELRPLEVFEVQVMFVPHKPCSKRSIFQLSVEDGNKSSIAFYAEVQQPQVCLLNSLLSMEGIYLDVESTHTVTLYNNTLLQAHYEWGKLEGSEAKRCTIDIDQSIGTMESRETKEFKLKFTPHSEGLINDVRLPCYITYMSKPLYLALSVDVLGLSVTYTVDGVSGDDVSIDFGSDLHIGQQETRRLVIENTSGITAPYHITCDYYTTRPPTPPQRPPLRNTPKIQRRPINSVASSAQLSISNQPPKDVIQKFLQEDKGAAFLITPSTGILQPFSTETIQITAFSDMWGHYSDHLICKVQDLNVVRIPMSMSVIGCPLIFQMVAAEPTRAPILRFGSHVSGIEPITRQMRINNPSPKDIRIDWQMYNLPEEIDKETIDDKKPLDFIVSYSESFPLLDENGVEIVPQQVDDTPCSTGRPPTELIIDSPCTSDLTSRQLTISSGEEAKKLSAFDMRPRIISVTLRSHIGERSNEPFNITPQQLVIPGRSNNVVKVQFSPTPGVESKDGCHCTGLATAYMSLKPQDKEVPEKVKRDHGYDVSPLKLNMTAHIKPALLTIQCEDDEGLNYRTPASDLIQHGQFLAEWHKVSFVTLSNNTENELCFNVQSADPFYLVQLDPFTQQPCIQLIQTGMTSLMPRQNIRVHVSFRVDLDLIQMGEKIGQAVSQTQSHPDYSDAAQPSQPDENSSNIEVKQNDRERRMVIKNDLQIQFNNGTSQRIPLEALVLLPSLYLTKDNIDFGTCLVGQTRQAEVTLVNPSGSVCHWHIEKEYMSESKSEDIFSLTPKDGQLEAYTTYISQNKVIITLMFTARHTEECSAVYSFHHLLADCPQYLTLKGQGSYDGKHEALVNV